MDALNACINHISEIEIIERGKRIVVHLMFGNIGTAKRQVLLSDASQNSKSIKGDLTMTAENAINLMSGEKTPQAITLRPESMSYLIHGELNLSCKAIITHTMGLPLDSMLIRQYPRDIESIRFCRLLLENCPEIAANFNFMVNVSPKWAAIVQEEAWATLCDAMDTECPNWRNTLWKDGGWRGQSALAVLKKALNPVN